ncbi:MAG: pyridoxal phosphate-dependent aminotransferase [Syntrophorhabdus aromaticivorans]|uniref:Pyridoxal phosphate-dependent aminotransferase n=1 Tax=Syntrophorhabdus aromaticivorans TaxID=328301 RepID=A0A971M5Q5_9BACT|nr:pyridoxal phosphate-dependent aminotransferase [Syntrophorhabdus aromaticivorans]
MRDGPARIFLSPPHMTGREMDFIRDVFESNWIAPLGPHVDAFEQEMAAYVGVKSALALSSGTAAIHLGLRLLGAGSGDIVFCSSLTFSASANPIMYVGASPVFIDSAPHTWNMCPEALKLAFEAAEKESRLPKAVIVVDLYGQSADYDPIIEICDHYGVPVLSDATEALGATYKGKKCGALGKLAALSFNGNKIITTSGGGMLLSDDENLIAKASFWATQARDPAPHYQHSEVGYNYRLSNILAAVGRPQLQEIETRVQKRREIFDRYQEALDQIPGVDFMPEASYGRANRWLTVMTLDPKITGLKPMDIIQKLEENNIESRPVWKPMHLQPVFEKYPFFTAEKSKPFGENAFETSLCLPSGTSLCRSDTNRIIAIISKALGSRD